MANNPAIRHPIIVKIGGSTLGSGDTTLADLAELHLSGQPIVVVHGGGKIITEWMDRLGIIPQFTEGLRITDDATLKVVIAVLSGLVNTQIVADLQALGAKAIGINGADGGLLRAKVQDPALGAVGAITDANQRMIYQLLELCYIPVIAPIAMNDGDPLTSPNSLLNINADAVAGALAKTIKADQLIFLTDVEGILGRDGNVIRKLLPNEAQDLINSGTISGGMIPKLQACLDATPYVYTTKIVDGRKPNALLKGLHYSISGTTVG